MLLLSKKSGNRVEMEACLRARFKPVSVQSSFQVAFFVSPEVRGHMRSRSNWVSRGLFLFCFSPPPPSPFLSSRRRRRRCRFNWSNGSRRAPTAELESGTHARFALLRTRCSDVRRVCQGLGGAVSTAPRQPFFFSFHLF